MLTRTVRFLDLIKPFTPLLPEVASPETKVPFNQKLMWTGVRSSLPPGDSTGREDTVRKTDCPARS